MTRLDRIIKVINDYKEIAEDLAWVNSDHTHDRKLDQLQEEVRELVAELKRYGCRREK